MLKNLIAGIILLLIIIFSFSDCAKMGSVSGGERDTIPPVVIGSKPENYSLNFNRSTVEITFDEFVILKNINQELIISPPLEERIVVKQRGKTVILELDNELKKNTTYTLNFGRAIEDNHEGNILLNYEFVFSTGSHLDSMAIHGQLLRAFDLMPPKDPVNIMLYGAFDLMPPKDPVNIMLYDTLYDSAFIKERPLYIGKTDKEGFFRINNLKTDTFRIFALSDLNSNFRFDLPNEEIAFLDTSLILLPHFLSSIMQDTLHFDSIKNVLPDTLKTLSYKDSAYNIQSKGAHERIIVDLFLFMEDHEKQFLKDAERKSRHHIFLSFNLPVTDSFSISSFKPPRNDWYLLEESANRDSFELWIMDTLVIAMDSIFLGLNYTVKDSMLNPVTKIDSVHFAFRELASKSNRRGKEEVEVIDTSLKISTISKMATLESYSNLSFKSEFPFSAFDTTYVRLYSKPDSVEFSQDYEMFRDSLNLRKVFLRADWQENTAYRLEVFPGAFTGIYGYTNDSINVPFKIRDGAYYGNLLLNVTNVGCQQIVELTKGKNEIVQKKIIKEDGKIEFTFLGPGKYKIKFIDDCNENGKWDTGNYLMKIQPEKAMTAMKMASGTRGIT